ncbi:hypothetical protein QYM36_001248 [Artemia franciscana]|uniref:UBC core domain-containing protein n=1 Tax=Artemia franciscana TaxID=6661 RepID=A0AA88IAW0_ARTSF|nr:hypothetical protein QYM36_001248 [Artemia franciscana]
MIEVRVRESGGKSNKRLIDQKIPGLYVIPSSRSLYEWYGVLFVHSNLYQGGVFRFTLTIPANFPEGMPRIYFEIPVFHPNVNSQTGEVNIGNKWNPKSHSIYHALIQTCKLMQRPDFNNPICQEATTLYIEDKSEFMKRVDKSIFDCRTRLFNCDVADPYYPRFSPFNKSIHGQIMEQMKRRQQSKVWYILLLSPPNPLIH